VLSPLAEKCNDVDPVMSFDCSRNDWRSYIVLIDFEGRKRNVASRFMDHKVNYQNGTFIPNVLVCLLWGFKSQSSGLADLIDEIQVRITCNLNLSQHIFKLLE